MKKTIEVIKDIRTLCTHIFEGGHRCASPALQREAFCYYHHPTRKPAQHPTRRRSRRQSFDLPLPSGQSNLQGAVYEVIRRLAANQISSRRAGQILNALDNITRNPPSSLQQLPRQNRVYDKWKNKTNEGIPRHENDPQNAVRFDSVDPLRDLSRPGPHRPSGPTPAARSATGAAGPTTSPAARPTTAASPTTDGPPAA
jgi:hypothetical protein